MLVNDKHRARTLRVAVPCYKVETLKGGYGETHKLVSVFNKVGVRADFPNAGVYIVIREGAPERSIVGAVNLVAIEDNPVIRYLLPELAHGDLHIYSQIPVSNYYRVYASFA